MALADSDRRLLVFDCHEAWVFQLRALEQPIDVLVGLKGRHTGGWDEAMRPVPPNARLVRLEEVLAAKPEYACIVAHNLSDLLDVKALPGPRLFVIHMVLEGLLREQGSGIAPQELRRTVAQYLRLIGAHTIAVSRLKGRSWGMGEDVVPFSADAADYLPYHGELACGLRIANDIRAKAHTLLWEFHEKTFAGLPVTLVGRNGNMPGVRPARDWNELKEILSRHRFFIHTADPSLEDGCNMATLEAMAAGLPVLGNRHPGSPVIHGVSGFLSDDPQELRGFARRLLDDRELAVRMGREAQRTAAAKYSPENFKIGLSNAIATAQRKWRLRSMV
jgi:glycosyltransferase involved in cell wall biosynthesis